MPEGNQATATTPAEFSEVFHSDCPARGVLDHITSRWGIWVLLALNEGDKRFFELRDSIEGVSEKMLSQTLRDLAGDGLVWREVEPTVPPKVTYGLNEVGRGVSVRLVDMFRWIGANAENLCAEQAEPTGSGPAAR